MPKVEDFDLKLHAYRLLMDEPFFACLSRKIEKRVDKSISTAGVRVDEKTGQFEMIYNPEFLGGLPENQVAGVLKHEMYHLIFEHCVTRKPEGVPHKTWNIAAETITRVGARTVIALPKKLRTRWLRSDSSKG